MSWEDSKFPQEYDERLFFNGCDLGSVDIHNGYEKLIVAKKYSDASKYLDENLSITGIKQPPHFGAWLFNRFGNQCHAIGEYLKNRRGLALDANGNWVASTTQTNDSAFLPKFSNEKETAIKNTDGSISYNNRIYTANNISAKIDLPSWMGTYQFDWASIQFTNDEGVIYYLDPYGDKAYPMENDTDGGYYYITTFLRQTPLTYYKDHNYEPWKPYSYYEGTTNKYYLYFDSLTKVLLSQEPDHSLALVYLADDYYKDGTKHWYFDRGVLTEDNEYIYEQDEYFLNDGDPDNVPSPKLESYFYYQYDDVGRMIKKDTNEYVTTDGTVYYISDSDTWVEIEDGKYQQVIIENNKITSYVDNYRNSLGEIIPGLIQTLSFRL